MLRSSRRQLVERKRSWSRHRTLHHEQLEDRRVLSASPLLFDKVFSPDTIGPGSVSTLTFTIENTNPHGETDLAFTDTLPAGVTIAAPANASTDCIDAILSAPDGGGMITFSGARIGAGESCSVQVDVTSSTVGTHMNVSSTLTTAAAPASGPATDDLMVVTTLPGFSKSFSPSNVNLGGRSTLTLTIDNTANESPVPNLDFTDNLPIGMEIASPASASTTCGTALIPPSLAAASGTGNIVLSATGTLGFPAVAAGATCTVTVDVVATGVGMLDNVSGELLAEFVSSGKASATLESTVTTVALDKDFINDPVPPGGTVTVDFIVTNRDRSDSATAIAFTDDLASGLAGLTFTSLLGNDCGGTVTGVGTTDLGLTGGTLAAGAFCTLSASLSVPAGTALGAYTNTTGAITATLGGSPVVGNMAADDLFVEPTPLLTKEFLNAETLAPDPVINAGDDIVIRFTIENTSTSSGATDITFGDELTTFLPFPVMVTLPPTPDPPCGPGSSLTLVSFGTDRQGLQFADGTLDPAAGAGSTCSFDVTLTVPGGVAPGIYVNTTEEITATVDGATRIGKPASDDFTVIAAPTLQTSFVDDPVAPGDTVTLEFTLDYPADSPVDATDITFTDDLAAVLTGLTATGLPLPAACDPDGPGGSPGSGTLSGSAGDTLLTFMGGSLMPGESCTFSVMLDVPVGAVAGSYTNTTSDVSATVGGLAATSAPASDDLDVAGLIFSKEFLKNPVIPGDTTTLRFTIGNVHPTDDATITLFTDNLAANLAGLAATGPASVDTCGGSLSGTTFLSYAGGSVLSGESCSIEVEVLVPAAATDGSYSNLTSSLAANQGGAVTIDPAFDVLEVDSSLLQLTKEFTDDPVNPGGSVTLDLTLTNLDAGQAASDISFSDDLGAALPGLTFDSLVSDTCGGTTTGVGTTMLSVSSASLPAGGTCTILASLAVPAGAAAGIYSNTTSAVAGTIGGFAVNGPAASDDLDVVDLLAFSKSFDGPTTATGTPVLTFTISNPTPNTATGLAFSDALDDVLTGLVATNLPLSDACGVGSLLSGTSLLMLTGGELAPMSSCTFDVELLVPGTATAGTFPNTTSGLFQSGIPVADPATADLVIEPPPTFAKSFSPATIAAGEVSTLTFTIDNSASALDANDLSFIDNFPTGVVIAVPTNASKTCAGGMGDASPGATSFSFAGGSVGAASSCTIQFDVTSVLPDTYVNTTENLTSSSGNSGTATDTLTVTATPPVFSKSFTPDTIAAGGVSTLTFTIDNSASLVAASDLSFIDNFPAGVVIADPTNASTTCAGGMGDASPGATSFSFAGGTVGAASSCTIQFDVTSVIPDTYVNTTDDLTSSSGNSGTATDTLAVTPAQAPSFSKSFAPNPIGLNETSTLTFTIDNTASAVPASSLAFSDTLPAGIVISATPNATTDCTGGLLSAAAGTILIEYSGGGVAAGASCTVRVNVIGTSVGSHPNTSEALTSSLGNSGTASDTLTVETLTFDKSFLPAVIGVGSTSTLTFEIVNLINNPVSDLAFTDNLPAGLIIAAPANASSSCGGTVDAPNGGSTIALSAGGVGPLGSCTVTVDVTSSIADTYTNVTSGLQSSAGNVQPASADLIVTNDRPGFSKSFSPDSISLGARSTLTFTIDNSANGGSAATELDFTDNLPAGVVIASPANASTSCSGGVLTAVPGTNLISYTMGSIDASASCAVSVDVVATAVGLLGNTSGELTSLIDLAGAGPVTVASGKASAVLEVIGDPLSLIKSFTNDPVPPGGTVILEFVITNFSRDESATNITFTDNLDAMLAGLVAVGLPVSDVCGTGSTLLGSSLLTLSGASLGPGESCTFSTTLQVPAAAATGVYPNTTSSITGDVGGVTVTGAPGSDDLFVQTAPILTKSFTDDPVGGGSAVNLHFNIQNTSTTFSAVDIAFTDNLDAILSGLTVATLPANGFCGAGSSLTAALIGDELTLVMAGSSLAAGGSCGFDVTLLVPAGALGGAFTNTTSEIIALVDDVPLTGKPASDDLVVVAAPRLTKEFTDDPVLPGANANLQFTLSYDSEGDAGDATNINFTDNLNSALAGLSAVGLPLNNICGTGSQLSGTTNLSFTGGGLTPGSTCTFSVPVKVPLASLPGSFTNETSNVTATVDGVTAMNAPATDDLQVAGLAIAKEFTDDPVPAGGTVTLQFTIDNVSQVADATNITFTDNLDDTLTGLVATGTPLADVCGTGSQFSGTSLLELTGGNLTAGESCTFSVTLQVPAAAASDQYVNTTSHLDALVDGTSVSLDPATDVLTVASDLLLLDKRFVEDSAFPGDTVTLDFTITNLDASQSATDITFTDDLNAALVGLTAIGLPASGVCGAGSQLTGTNLLTLTGGTLGPGASCSFSATLQLPSSIPLGSSVSNVTSQATGDIGGLQVTGDPASDQLLIDFFRFSKSFDGLTAPGGTPALSFTIENLGAAAASDISFSDNLGAVIPGLTATGLPASGVCGAGSQLAGTSILTFAGGSLAAGSSCTFDVTLQVPLNAQAGTFTNVTSDLLVAGAFGSSPAVDSLTVVPPPDFDKTFTPEGIAVTGTSTLSFSINNSDGPVGATSLAFTDNLPAGVTVAVPPNASTTCVGGMLTAAAGSSVITYSGGSVAAGASCSVQVDVTSALSGSHLNVSGDLTSSLGNSGPASATLISQIMLMGGPFTPGVNILTTSQGLSDAITILVKGTQPGSAQLTVQDVTFTTAFADPAVVAFAETDANGAATFVQVATVAQVGQVLQFQAVQILPVLDVSAVLSVPVVDAPLLAAGGQAVLAQGESAGGTTLTPAMLRGVAAQAVERWEGMGLTQAEIDLLHSVQVKIADLSAGLLGQLVGNTISIDYSAADHGWFVDGTLGDSTEFGTTLSQSEVGADTGGPADRRMDLFTAVLHEFGHVLRFQDTSPNDLFRGVMTAELSTGIRRLPRAWQNPSRILDVNDDGHISPLDGLILINEVNAPKFRDVLGRLPSVVPLNATRWFLDTNGDGFATAVDALRVFNHIDSTFVFGEGEGASVAPQHIVDLALLDLRSEQLVVTAAQSPRQTISLDNGVPAAKFLAVQSVASGAKEPDSQQTTSQADAAGSDLALLEWLEQQSSDDL